jgi:hypothetical protein
MTVNLKSMTPHLHVPRAGPARGGDDDFGQTTRHIQRIVRLDAVHGLGNTITQSVIFEGRC